MNRSESIINIVTALNKFQSAIDGAKKSSKNPFYNSKYADLAEVWKTIREPLSENGLSVVQLCGRCKSMMVTQLANPKDLNSFQDVNIIVMELETILSHNSGEYISSIMELPISKNDPQGAGSAITYARRYALSAILGIHQTDDDANISSHNKQKERTFDDEMKDAVKLMYSKRVPAEYDELLNAVAQTQDKFGLAGLVNKMLLMPDYLSVSDAKKQCAVIIQQMVDRKIDGFDVETRRKNSFTKHLGTETLNECKDREKLNDYLASLKERVK